MPIYLGPWIWVEKPRPRWEAPGATAWRLDLRPRAGRAATGGRPQGLGLFALKDALADSTSYVDLGDDLQAELKDDQRQAWADALGLKKVPPGPTLADVIVQTLTLYADPDDAKLCPPILPGVDGVQRVTLGGEVLSAKRIGPTDPEFALVRSQLQSNYRKLRQQAREGNADPEAHRKFLTVCLEKFGLQGADAYQQFIPQGLPDEKPRPKETTIQDDFNRADADPISTGSFAWSMIESSNLEIVSNQARTADDTGAPATARAESDLSSDDHYAQAVVGASDESISVYGGPTCRNDSGALTFYLLYLEFDLNQIELYEVTAGTFTQIDVASYTLNSGTTYTAKVSADGSAIKGYINGAEELSATDSAITGNVRCGLRAETNITGHYVSFDNFEASDISGAQTATPGTATVAISGVAPAASGTSTATATPGTATVTIAGVAPAASGTGTGTATPGTATVAISGVDASATPGTVTLTPDTATVAVSGVSTSASGAGTATATPAVATVTISGVDTSASAGSATATPGTATVAVSGIDPAASGSGAATAIPDVATVAVSGVAPAASGSGSVTAAPGTATVTITAEDATATSTLIGTPGVATVAVSGIAPVASGTGTGTATPGTATVGVAGAAPVASGSGTITGTPAAATVAVSGTAPAASATGTVSATPGTATVTITAADASAASGSSTATPGIATVSVSGTAPAASGTGTATATALAATVTLTAVDCSAEHLAGAPYVIELVWSDSSTLELSWSDQSTQELLWQG